jgi:hypothetical protein
MRTKLALRLHDDAEVVAIGSGASAFARAIAAARSGTAATARTERDKLDKTDTVRRELIDAAIARRAGDAGGSVAAYALAYGETKTSNPGDPKDYWPVPVGEGYGAALLAASKPAQAETVFTAELVRFPNDPRLEWGLAEALLAQHKDDAAARAAYKAHWKGTGDLTLDRLG